jgi:hypothetical protein
VIINVWLIYKKGEPRTYTTTVQPDEERAKAYRSQGFSIYRAEVNLPVSDDVDDVLPSLALICS